MKELYIDRGITQSRAALFCDESLVELYIENTDFTSINGNIYRSKIENIEEGLCAAFVNIGFEKNALLHFEDLSQLKQYKRGQELIVQVTREASGTKGPRVSTQLSLPGKYVVLLPDDNYIGVSKKIEDPNKRRKIKKYFESVIEENYGVIARTESEDINVEELYCDYVELKENWKAIERNSQYLKTPALLFDSKNFYDYIIREYIKTDIKKIFINNAEELNLFKDKLHASGKFLDIQVCCDEFNFTLQDRIDREINRANERIIPLPSGGYIAIDYTEAFTCIDVNSGSYTGSDDAEKTILSVNLEACIEIENAIRVRRLSGIILIDFIDMKLEKNRIEVIDALTKAFYYDSSNFTIYGFTRLGILETTRTKNGIKLSEFIFSNLQSNIQSPAYCLKLIENKCIKALRHYNKNSFEIILEAGIYDLTGSLLNEFISSMRSIYGIELQIARNTTVKGFSVINGN